MINALLGFKLKQSQEFSQDGRRIPVTEVNVGPCYVTQIQSSKTGDRIQLGFGNKKNIKQSQIGHLKKAGLEKKLRFLREFTVAGSDPALTLGKEILLSDVFKEGDRVEVTGTSIGKGFASVIKRYHFQGGPRTHGQSDRERSPGSIGQTTTPGRVYRGKRMAGRMGNDRVTVKGLKVISVDASTNILTIKGLVPGPSKGLLIISKI